MNAFITVGIPGSGKTFWATQQAAAVGGFNLNLDDCRQVVSGDASNQACTMQAVALHGALLDALIAQGVTIYVSDTNLNSHFRDALVAKLEAAGYTVTLMVFDTPSEVCRERNARRAVPVPEHAMDRMEAAMAAFMAAPPVGAVEVRQWS